MAFQITTQIKIQLYSDFWYTVEDVNIDVGCDGCTISHWEYVDTQNKRVNHICVDKDDAIAIADSIYKLFGKNIYDTI